MKGGKERERNDRGRKGRESWDCSVPPPLQSYFHHWTFLRPTCTIRWCSEYYAVERVVELGLGTVVECQKALRLNQVTPIDMKFLHSFIKVMTPLIIAMKLMEGENHCYISQLIPTIMWLKQMLEAPVKNQAWTPWSQHYRMASTKGSSLRWRVKSIESPQCCIQSSSWLSRQMSRHRCMTGSSCLRTLNKCNKRLDSHHRPHQQLCCWIRKKMAISTAFCANPMSLLFTGRSGD